MSFTVVVTVRCVELPQPLSAVTVIVPPVVPAVAEILFVALVPEYPEVKVQV